jgi:hypothetical protein
MEGASIISILVRVKVHVVVMRISWNPGEDFIEGPKKPLCVQKFASVIYSRSDWLI